MPRSSKPPFVLLLVVALLLAGCAEPSDGNEPVEDPAQDPAAEGSSGGGGGVTTRLPSPPEVQLLVTDLGDGTATVEMTNNRPSALSVERDRFTFVDGTGASFAVNATATDAQPNAFPAEVQLAPDGNVSGVLAFDLQDVQLPVRVVYDNEGVQAAWLLHSSDFPVTLDPQDDTSFGAAIVAPANATFHYQVHDATSPIDVCLIMEADHQTWHEGSAADGLACRTDVTSADVSATVPEGEYNLGMYCRSETDACSFTVTVVLAW